MIQIVPLESGYYDAYYALVQSTPWGNPMLPRQYNSSLWGMVLLDDEVVVGGWVGTLRGDKRLVRLLAKSVYFDSYPVFATTEVENGYADKLLDAVRDYAHASKVIMLNLTHWVRGNGLTVDKPEDNATFVYDLSTPLEDLYAKLDRLKKRTIKKAEAAQLEVKFYYKNEALLYIQEFQALREVTQQRAIAHNSSSSMLLKSNAFFHKILTDYEAYLVAVYWQGRMVAAATFLCGGQTVYGHMAGSDSDANRQTGSGTYYYWKAVEYFQQKGLKFFDFGGCPVNPKEDDPAYGVYMFKQGFGADYVQNKAGRIIISPRRYRLLQWALSQRKLLRMFSSKL